MGKMIRNENANDTAKHVIVNIVTAGLDEALAMVHNWYKMNFPTPHPGETEHIIIGSKSFAGQFKIMRANTILNLFKSLCFLPTKGR